VEKVLFFISPKPLGSWKQTSAETTSLITALRIFLSGINFNLKLSFEENPVNYFYDFGWHSSSPLTINCTVHPLLTTPFHLKYSWFSGSSLRM
jgi:hypothetical protein